MQGNLSFRFSHDRSNQDVEEGSTLPHARPAQRRSKPGRLLRRHAWAPGWAFGICCLLLLLYIHRGPNAVLKAQQEAALSGSEVLVSYSYFEKDSIQRDNAEFFWKMGMGIGSHVQPPQHTSFVVVVNGETCSPCGELYPLMESDSLVEAFPLTLRAAWSAANLTLLWRTENEGMDFAAHNVTLEWLKSKRQGKRYRFYIFLNSSVRGPFVPAYMPPGWQWTRAFTDRLGGPGDVRGVSSSLVCLPEVDAGGRGPRMESWAFALDQIGLDVTTEAGVFWLRKCKLCTDDSGIVVKGEYGLSQALLMAGHNFATLMARYRAGVDWRDEANWGCNDYVHPSRHGTYGSISMHPFETVFLKASWHVGEPHLGSYTRWLQEHSATWVIFSPLARSTPCALQCRGSPHATMQDDWILIGWPVPTYGMLRAQGGEGTAGKFDEAMYRFAISMEAQEPNHAAECYKVLPSQ